MHHYDSVAMCEWNPQVEQDVFRLKKRRSELSAGAPWSGRHMHEKDGSSGQMVVFWRDGERATGEVLQQKKSFQDKSLHDKHSLPVASPNLRTINHLSKNSV